LARPHPENRILVTTATLSKFLVSTWSIKYISTFSTTMVLFISEFLPLPQDKKTQINPKWSMIMANLRKDNLDCCWNNRHGRTIIMAWNNYHGRSLP